MKERGSKERREGEEKRREEREQKGGRKGVSFNIFLLVIG